MDSKSEQWEILDNSPSPDNYMFQCLEQKLRASGKRQIICDSWSRRESKLHLNVIKLRTTKWEKKVPSVIARPLEGGRGSEKGGMYALEKRWFSLLYYYLEIISNTNLIFESKVYSSAPPLPPFHTHIHPHTHIFYIYYQLTTEIKITFLFIILWWFLISPWLFSLCPYGQWEGGSVDVDRCWQEEEGSKITGNVWIFFMDDF